MNKEKLREIIDEVLCEFADLSGDYVEARKEDLLESLCLAIEQGVSE